ncbi:MAG: hypothetical protein LBI61_01220 [Puniceicoccales bacterium]|nr:hypothetical protein [Puniceicoccales bacterium]
MRDFSENYDNISDEDFCQRRREFEVNLEELTATKDQEVLEYLMDFFDEDFDYSVEGVCGSIKARIGANFTLDQLIEAFYKRFDKFAGKYLGKCAEMSMWCVRNRQIDDYHWDRFREMFNAVKSKHSAKILEKLKDMFEDGAQFDEDGVDIDVGTVGRYRDLVAREGCAGRQYRWTDEERKMVYTLEEDMKSW